MSDSYRLVLCINRLIESPPMSTALLRLCGEGTECRLDTVALLLLSTVSEALRTTGGGVASELTLLFCRFVEPVCVACCPILILLSRKYSFVLIWLKMRYRWKHSSMPTMNSTRSDHGRTSSRDSIRRPG